MTREEALEKCALFDAMKHAGSTEDEIWAEVFEGLSEDDILLIIEVSMDLIKDAVAEAVANGDDKRIIWAIFSEWVVGE